MLGLREFFLKYGENSASSNTNVNSKFVAEWVVNPELIISAIYTATTNQAAFTRDIVNLITEYLQNHEALKSLSIFDPTDWTTVFNKKVEMIKPPPELDAFLQRTNPFTGKKNAESSLCVFIPSHFQNMDIPTLNIEHKLSHDNSLLIPLTPETMEGLIRNTSKLENQSKYMYFLDYYNGDSTSQDLKEVRKKLRDLHVDRSYWVVITKDIIPNSRGELYAAQQNLIIEKGSKEYWQVPSIREAVVCAFAHYAKTGVRILNDNPSTYTRCVEIINGYHTIVGSFSQGSGLNVNISSVFLSNYGIVAVRKFAY